MSPCSSLGRDVRIRKVLARIAQDPAVSVQSLALMVKLSSSRLGHLFKADTGMELRHFLVESRLEKATELLRNTDMQIKEISHTVGYQHVPSFDRVFRKRFHVSPADYRRHDPLQETEDFHALLLTGVAHNGHSGKG